MSTEVPRRKKLKVAEEVKDVNDDDEKEEVAKPFERNADGEPYCALSPKRRITVREFKGATLLDIREEFYEKGTKVMPGKKGISLTKEQYENLRALVLNGSLDREIAAFESKTDLITVNVTCHSYQVPSSLKHHISLRQDDATVRQDATRMVFVMRLATIERPYDGFESSSFDSSHEGTRHN